MEGGKDGGRQVGVNGGSGKDGGRQVGVNGLKKGGR